MDPGSILKTIPRRMGVYFLKDSRDRIIYIGKAVDLRSRIRSHLTPGSGAVKAVRIAARTSSVDYIPCETEVEALILEQNLIKEHRPRYNVDLKDDKRYPFLKLTNEPYPRLFKTREVEGDGASYFGPYTSVAAMEGMLESILSIFPLRTCSSEIPFTDPDARECLEYHIGRCGAPCTGRMERDAYDRMVAEAALFLRGHTGTLLEQMEQDMQTAAEARQYEHARVLRDRIRAIRRATQRQRVVSEKRVDFDLVTHVREGREGVGVVFQVREGTLLRRETYSLTLPAEEDEGSILSGLLIRHYLRASHIPPVVYVPFQPSDQELVEQALSVSRGKRARLRLARAGPSAEVLEMAATDATLRLREMQARRTSKSDFVPKGIALLQKELDLPRPPIRIEAIDVSHLQGSDAVAALVSFKRGEPVKSGYRRFRLRRAHGGDDPAGIAEVVERHYRKLLAENGEDALPDLLLIDGGSTQLEAAVRVLDALGLDRQTLPVIGLAKRLEEIYLPDTEGPQSLSRGSPALRLLQRIRDEVHRFAVGYHRNRRAGRVKATLLTEVNGVGEDRARLLLEHFGSVTRMMQSGEEAIARLDGFGPVLARRIVDAMGSGGER
ncbi:excinuclease ABC subunit UvrC [Gemmatimonadota bacterium]